MKMTITEWWTTEGIAGEQKARIVYSNAGGWTCEKEAVRELSARFKNRLVYKGKNELFFAEDLYLQRISFSL